MLLKTWLEERVSKFNVKNGLVESAPDGGPLWRMTHSYIWLNDDTLPDDDGMTKGEEIGG